jgi:hypothetical protein
VETIKKISLNFDRCKKDTQSTIEYFTTTIEWSGKKLWTDIVCELRTFLQPYLYPYLEETAVPKLHGTEPSKQNAAKTRNGWNSKEISLDSSINI